LELTADLVSMDNRYASEDLWRRVASVLRDGGMAATLHLPFVWVDLASLDRGVWEGSLDSLEAALRFTRPLEPLMAAVHPANYATQAALAQTPERDRPAFLGALVGRVGAALARLRKSPGGDVIALENLEGVPPELLFGVAEAAGVGVCLDIGHALADGCDPGALLGRVRSGLVGLHLHDAVPREGAHKPLGTGRLDLGALAGALKAACFEGPVVLEVVGSSDDEERSARLFARAIARAG